MCKYYIFYKYQKKKKTMKLFPSPHSKNYQYFMFKFLFLSGYIALLFQAGKEKEKSVLLEDCAVPTHLSA